MIVDDFLKLIEDNKKSFTEDEYGLFHDSVKCFYASIYRPAYIMAYQGMMIYFRRIIQNAKMPTGYDSGKWTGVQTRLSKDKEWEDEVNNAIRTQPDPKKTPPVIAIMSMADSLRKDFDFWRNRRNDCVHYKEYNINDSHVLAFYSFLTQYLLKISVEGGKATLLNEFKDACDPIKTSPNISLQPLVDKILVMVSPEEMDDFFEELEGAMGYRFNGKYERLLASIIKGGNEVLRDYAIKFVKNKKVFKAELINSHPDLVGHLVDSAEVREFWMRYLKSCKNRVAVLARMIMIGLISPSEKNEAMSIVLKHGFDNNDGMGEVTEVEILALKTAGFFNVLKKEYFNGDYTSNNALNCGKNKYDFFYGFVAHLPVDKDFVDMMVDIFSQANYPYVWANILKEHFLEKDATYKAEFDKVVSENGITLPECLRID